MNPRKARIASAAAAGIAGTLRLDRDGERVTLEHPDPRAGRTDGGGMRLAATLAEATENLPRLGRDLLFFLRDVRNHVVDDVERHDAQHRPAPEMP